MKDWFLRQSPRDRIIVLLVSALVLLGMLYALVLYPMQSNLSTTRQALKAKTETLEFLQQGAATLDANRGAGGGDKRDREGKPPYLLITEVISKAGIEQPQGVDPTGSKNGDGGTGARVKFTQVEFDKLVQVIAELEMYGLQITTINFTRSKDTGKVSARFNMELG
ncbi:MAG: type II secretion system protein GspM [Granulosicoccus sp.]